MSPARRGPAGQPATPPAGEPAAVVPATADACQRDWLTAAQGQPVWMRLLSGKAIAGTLVAWDQETFAVSLAGFANPMLVRKRAVTYMVRGVRDVRREP